MKKIQINQVTKKKKIENVYKNFCRYLKKKSFQCCNLKSKILREKYR